MTTEINLQQFCGDGPFDERRGITKPFTAGEFTWATNAYIAIRVPARPEYGPQEKPINTEAFGKIIDDFGGDFSPLANFTLPEFVPEEQKIKCRECDGRGTEHDCPDCTCKCTECDGSGVVELINECSCEIFGATFNIKYLRLVFALPNVIAGVDSNNMMAFRFDGGAGILIAMRGNFGTHHVLIPHAEAAE